MTTPENTPAPETLLMEKNSKDLSHHDKEVMLELLEEKPVVAIQRVEVGKLQVRKEIRTQQIQVPVTLKQEVLVIQHEASPALNQPLAGAQPSEANLVTVTHSEPVATKIVINGKEHDLTQPIELVISQEIAKVQVQTLVAEVVKLTTTTQEHSQAIPVELRHEELVTNQVNYDEPKVLYQKQAEAVEIKPI